MHCRLWHISPRCCSLSAGNLPSQADIEKKKQFPSPGWSLRGTPAGKQSHRWSRSKERINLSARPGGSRAGTLSPLLPALLPPVTNSSKIQIEAAWRSWDQLLDAAALNDVGRVSDYFHQKSTIYPSEGNRDDLYSFSGCPFQYLKWQIF